MAGSIPKTGNITKESQTKRTPKKAPAKRPGRALAVVKSKVADKGDFTEAKAKALTKKIQTGLEDTVNLLQQAWEGRIWLALGHKTWDDYVKAEFPTAPLALPMSKRKPTVASLAERGWSSRAIATVTGVDKDTVNQDIRDVKAEQLAENPPVDGDTEPQIGDDGEVIEGEIVSEDVTRTVNSLDGKERTVTVTPAKPKGVVVNIVSNANTVKKSLEKVYTDLCALYDRDDYEENKEAVDGVLEQAIDDLVELVESKLREAVSQ
jgi:hypothetical protein